MTGAETTQTASELRLAVGQLVRRLRTRDELPFGQGTVLGLLDREGPKTTSELAGAARVRPQSMARTIGQLATLGYLEARPHPTDGRKTLLALTDAGHDTIRRQRERRVDWLAEAIDAELTPDEQRVLGSAVELLARLARNG